MLGGKGQGRKRNVKEITQEKMKLMCDESGS